MFLKINIICYSDTKVLFIIFTSQECVTKYNNKAILIYHYIKLVHNVHFAF